MSYPSTIDPLITIPPAGAPITETPTLPPVGPITYQLGFKAITGTVTITGYTEDFTGTPASNQFYVDGSSSPQTLNFNLSSAGASLVVKYNVEDVGTSIALAIDVISAQVTLLEKILGLNPQGTARNVSARIAAIELNLNRPISGSRIQGQYTGNITGMWLSADQSRIWFCTDTGEVWTATTLNDWVLQLRATFPLRSGTVFGSSIWAAGDGGVYRSRDGGTSWELLITSPGVTVFKKIQAISTSTIFAVGKPATGIAAGQNAVLESTDEGITWVTLVSSPTNDGCNFTSVRMSAVTNGVAVTNTGRIFRTTDTKTWVESLNGVAKWTQNGINDIWSFGTAPTARFRLVENSGIVRRSDDTGLNWLAETTPLSGVQLLAIFARTATDWVAVGTSGKAIDTTNGDVAPAATWGECDTSIPYGTIRAVVWGIDLDANGIPDIVAGGDGFLGRAEHPTCVFSSLFTGIAPTKLAVRSLFGLETTDKFTTTTSQTVFTLSATPVGPVKVFKNGNKEPQANVSVTGLVVTVNWLTPVTSGQYVEMVYFKAA